MQDVDYDLTRLGSREFEHLTQALALKVFGPSVGVFGDGPDGGREATYSGRVRWAPDDHTAGWNGYERPAIVEWIKEQGWGACIARRRREAPEVSGVDRRQRGEVRAPAPRRRVPYCRSL